MPVKSGGGGVLFTGNVGIGDYAFTSLSADKNHSLYDFTALMHVFAFRNGSLKVTFDGASLLSGGSGTEFVIYKNGVSASSVFWTNVTSFQSFTANITGILIGDRIAIMGKRYNGGPRVMNAVVSGDVQLGCSDWIYDV